MLTQLSRMCKRKLRGQKPLRLESGGQPRHNVDMSNWIVADAEHLGGAPRVRDTRNAVSMLLECFAAGMSVEEIVDTYPSLTTKSVEGVLRESAAEQTPLFV